ncbi:hypothetical protein MMPV_001606 [Pyropia vietnamensis]
MSRGAPPSPRRPFAGKVTLVTGGNAGVGYEFAAAMARGGATVVLACRNRTRGSAAVEALRREVATVAAATADIPLQGTTGGGGDGGGDGGGEGGGEGTVELLDLDTSDLESVATCAGAFTARHGRLDILMNNAGGMMLPWSLTRDGVEVTTATNFLGHFALTGRLWPLLAATPGARVVNVSSMVHVLATGKLDWEDMTLGGPRRHSGWAYVRSKLFNMLFTAELARRVAAADAAARPPCPPPPAPGFARTELVAKAQVNGWTNFCRATWGWASQSATDGAACLLAAATASWVSPATYVSPLWGGIRGRPSRGVPSLAARSVEDGGRLWAWAESVSGVRFL